MTEGKLSKKIFIEGTIEALTGLRVGGSDVGLSVGGADSIVVRNAMGNEPYIPGSSLKGKMRSLLEKVLGRFGKYPMRNLQVGPCKCGECEVCMIFGVAAEQEKPHPSRIIVRDALLLNSEELENARTDMPFTEIKTEVVIDRITSAATPRQIERVPAGAEFGMQLVLNVFEDDGEQKEKEMLENIFSTLRLIQDDYIGGSGSRGYGQVKITIERIEYKDADSYSTDGEAKKYTIVPIPAELQKHASV